MEEYTKEKMKDIMDITQSNYANMLKRLNRQYKLSNFVLIYYSIALIVYALTAVFFPHYYDDIFSNYFSIIFSVIMLAYSISNNNSKYSERIKMAESVLNSVKTMKRELTDENLQQKRMEYNSILDTAEYRAEVDFFSTLKQMCREYDVKWYKYKKDINEKIKSAKENEKTESQETLKMLKRLNNYLSEDYPFIQQLKIFCEYVLSGVVLLMPAVVFVICFFIKIWR